VSKFYSSDQCVVDNMRLKINDGEVFVLLGPSGCGKSTVLRMIAGLEEITSLGDLWLNGTRANDLAPKDRRCRHVLPERRALPALQRAQQHRVPLELAREDSDETHLKVTEMARALGIDAMLDRKPATLSGGQRQRGGDGPAMVRDPQVFLMDEPLSSLDAALRTELRIEIGGLVRSLRATTVYVTHDQVEALTLADRIGVMRDGAYCRTSEPPQQVYVRPRDGLRGLLPQLTADQSAGRHRWAVQGEGIHIRLGDQQITLPWSDPRSGSFHPAARPARHRRAPARRPHPDPAARKGRPGDLRQASRRRVPRARMDGLRPVEHSRPSTWISLAAGPALRPSRDPGRSFFRKPLPAPVEPAQAGQRRRTDILFRAGEARGLARGADVHLSVDLSKALFFGPDGRRVDPIHPMRSKRGIFGSTR
jgi:multiple sugar transport system ATP-binding protein